jgi:hypothetical protein
MDICAKSPKMLAAAWFFDHNQQKAGLGPPALAGLAAGEAAARPAALSARPPAAPRPWPAARCGLLAKMAAAQLLIYIFA